MSPNKKFRVKPLFELLLEENPEQFNSLVRQSKPPNLRGANVARLDLRKALLQGLDL